MFRICKSHADQSRCVADLGDACEALRVRLGYSDPDARTVALVNIRSSARAGQLILNLLDSWTIGDELVRQFIPQVLGVKPVSVESVSFAGDLLRKTNKLALLLLAHFQIENLLRNVHRDIGATPPPPRRFVRLATAVLDELGLPASKLEPLLAAAHLRNSLHSNGIHHNDAATITLGAVTYDFQPEQAVRCADWEHIAHALEHCIGVLADILMSPRVLAVKDPMMDHYAWEQATTP